MFNVGIHALYSIGDCAYIAGAEAGLCVNVGTQLALLVLGPVVLYRWCANTNAQLFVHESLHLIFGWFEFASYTHDVRSLAGALLRFGRVREVWLLVFTVVGLRCGALAIPMPSRCRSLAVDSRYWQDGWVADLPPREPAEAAGGGGGGGTARDPRPSFSSPITAPLIHVSLSRAAAAELAVRLDSARSVRVLNHACVSLKPNRVRALRADGRPRAVVWRVAAALARRRVCCDQCSHILRWHVMRCVKICNIA